jgi:thymidylate synthase
MTVIEAISPGDAFCKVSKHLLANGVKIGNLIEELNVMVQISKFENDDWFDPHFRSVMGEDRIDYASSVTFVEPEKSDLGLQYRFINDKWHESYWGRMISWHGEFNQIENVLKVLRTGQAVKRCELMVYDPSRDAKNPYSQPCMLAIDLKPRSGKLYLTAILRSNRISKSGYADYTALMQLGKFLARESNLELENISILACSCHIGTMNKEKTKTLQLLELLGR